MRSMVASPTNYRRFPGGARGEAIRGLHCKVPGFSLRRPHPNPLPEGEGTSTAPPPRLSPAHEQPMLLPQLWQR